MSTKRANSQLAKSFVEQLFFWIAEGCNDEEVLSNAVDLFELAAEDMDETCKKLTMEQIRFWISCSSSDSKARAESILDQLEVKFFNAPLRNRAKRVSSAAPTTLPAHPSASIPSSSSASSYSVPVASFAPYSSSSSSSAPIQNSFASAPMPKPPSSVTPTPSPPKQELDHNEHDYAAARRLSRKERELNKLKESFGRSTSPENSSEEEESEEATSENEYIQAKEQLHQKKYSPSSDFSSVIAATNAIKIRSLTPSQCEALIPSRKLIGQIFFSDPMYRARVLFLLSHLDLDAMISTAGVKFSYSKSDMIKLIQMSSTASSFSEMENAIGIADARSRIGTLVSNATKQYIARESPSVYSSSTPTAYSSGSSPVKHEPYHHHHQQQQQQQQQQQYAKKEVQQPSKQKEEQGGEDDEYGISSLTYDECMPLIRTSSINSKMFFVDTESRSRILFLLKHLDVDRMCENRCILQKKEEVWQLLKLCKTAESFAEIAQVMGLKSDQVSSRLRTCVRYGIDHYFGTDEVKKRKMVSGSGSEETQEEKFEEEAADEEEYTAFGPLTSLSHKTCKSFLGQRIQPEYFTDGKYRQQVFFLLSQFKAAEITDEAIDSTYYGKLAQLLVDPSIKSFDDVAVGLNVAAGRDTRLKIQNDSIALMQMAIEQYIEAAPTPSSMAQAIKRAKLEAAVPVLDSNQLMAADILQSISVTLP